MRIGSRPVWILRVRPQQAEHVCRHLSKWLARLRASGARKAVIDLSGVRRLDFAGFGAFLAKVRDVTGIPVEIRGARPYLAESLRQLDLLAGAVIAPPARVDRLPTHSPNELSGGARLAA